MNNKTPEPVVNVNEVSRISTGTRIKGEFTSPNDIRIDGMFEGTVNSQGRVVVGERAVVNGDIVCENVDLWGRMEGNLFVKDTLTLKANCVVKGNLHIRRLVVELGACFDGNCKMLSEQDITKLKEQPQQPAMEK